MAITFDPKSPLGRGPGIREFSRWREIFKTHGASFVQSSSFGAGFTPGRLTPALVPKQHALGSGPYLGKLERATLEGQYAHAVRAHHLAPVRVESCGPLVGAGLFADTPLPQGTFIGEYVGRLRCFPDREAFHRAARTNGYLVPYEPFTLAGEPLRYIDAREEGNPTRFVNHSATPNLDLAHLYLDDAWHLFFVANQAVEAGAQLTVRYSDVYWLIRGEEPVAL